MSLTPVPKPEALPTANAATRPPTLASLVAAPAATPEAQPQVTVAKDGKSVVTPTDAPAETVDLEHALEQAVAQLASAKANLEKVQALADKAKAAATPTPLANAAPAANSTTPATAPAAPAATTPAPAPAVGDKHTVKAGDTLSKIAKQYAGDPKAFKELLALNPHIKNPDKIYPGQVITLPASWKKPAAPATPATTPTAPATTGTTSPATPAPATTTPPAAPASGIDTSGVTGLADAAAMLRTTTYIQENFDKVAGADGKISKDDLQKNLPEGPGKAEYLKQFERLKFASIDPGADAWHNLTRQDIDEASRFLMQEIGDKRPADWELFSSFCRGEAADTQAFTAADKNADGKLTGDELPDALKNAAGVADGLDRAEYGMARAQTQAFPLLDQSAARIAAYEAQQRAAKPDEPVQK